MKAVIWLAWAADRFGAAWEQQHLAQAADAAVLLKFFTVAWQCNGCRALPVRRQRSPRCRLGESRVRWAVWCPDAWGGSVFSGQGCLPAFGHSLLLCV